MPFHIQPIREFLVRPAMPASLSRMPELGLQRDLELGARHPRAIPPPGSDLWRDCGYNPVLMLGRISQAALEKAAADHRYLALYAQACQRYDEAMQHRRAASDGRVDRVFFRRVRAYRMHADLLGRPGHPFRRSSEVGQQLRPAPGRRRPALSARLFPAVPEPGRLAAGALSDQRFLYAAHTAGDGRAGNELQGHGAAAHRQRVHPGVAHRCGPRPALPARYQHSRQSAAAGSRYHRFALWRRYGYAHPAGNRARHRRVAGAEGPGPGTHRVPHERRPLGVSGAGTDSSADARTQAELRRSAGSVAGEQCLHYPYVGAGRHRPVRSRPDVPLLPRVLRRNRHPVRPADGPRPAQRRTIATSASPWRCWRSTPRRTATR